MNTKIDVGVPSPEPAVVRATIRGNQYTFTELSMEAYDKLLKKATTTKYNEASGETEDETDSTLLMRLMILAATSPKPENIMDQGVRMYRAFAKVVNDLHYGEEPVKIESDDAEDEPKGKD